MQAGKAFAALRWLLPDFKLTLQRPISPPSVCKHLCVILINMAFKKRFEAVATGFFDHFFLGHAYLILLYFFHGDHNQLLFSLISAPLSLSQAN